MTLLESRVEGLWLAKQSAKGVPATTADKRWRKVGGDLNVNPDHGSENYSDGQRFGDTFDFYNTLVGEGSPVGQAQPGTVGHAAALTLGSETVTQVSTTGVYDHVATPGSSGYWITGWKKVGATVGPLRQQFNDSRPVSLRIEGSSANKVVKKTLQLVSIDPGQVFTSDPVKAIDSDLPFVYTEGVGRFSIDGTVYSGHSSFAVVIGDGVTPWYGDDVVPFDVAFGIATVALEAVTIAVDNAGLQRFNKQFYGTTSPAVGARPIKVVPANGSYTADLRKGSLQRIAITGTPTGGTFTVTVPGYGTTAAIAYNATSAAVATAIGLVVPNATVTATGGPLPGTPVDVTIMPQYLGAALTTTDSLTGGSTPASVVTDNGHARGLKIRCPGVHWSPDLAIAGNPDGGPTELPMTAQLRAVTGQPFVEITTRSTDAAAY